MTDRFRVAMAQMNPLVGDVHGNVERILAFAREAASDSASLVVFPELVLTGYPPEDLLHHPGLRRQVVQGLDRICREAPAIPLLVGYPEYEEGRMANAASLIRDGRIDATYRKQLLPNYSVFDEKRYFEPGGSACVIDVDGVAVGITICEDAWHEGPVGDSVRAGARLVVNLSASPYETDKPHRREQVFARRVAEGGRPVITVNQVGGQDELVFDGASFAIDADGRVFARAPDFEQGLYPVDFRKTEAGPVPVGGADAVWRTGEAGVYEALCLGVHDYARKNRFPGAVIGLSGGIDSSLTLAIAVDALGADNVTAVMMPSRFTSGLSHEIAEDQVRKLGVEYHTIPIEPMVAAFDEALAGPFAGRERDVTEENMQARIRGILLMALSNKFHRLVLTTGNKSELAVGYATLYGDMAGGFAPIRDCSKTLVYRLAEYRNTLSGVIPDAVIRRPPSAELAADQTDQDSLPPYEELDPILAAYVEDDLSAEEIVAAGHDPAVVSRVVAMVKRNEYKRRQAPPGVRISRRAFGRDRRYPITSGYDSTLD